MRKQQTVNITEGDRVLTFEITQMPALKLEKWIYRAAILIARATGATVAGDSIREARAAVKKIQDAAKEKDREEAKKKEDEGLRWIVSVIGGLDFETAEPLLDELLEGVKLLPEGAGSRMSMDMTPQTIEGQIESPLTLMMLRKEALRVNLSFFGLGKASTSDGKPSITFRKSTKTSAR